MKYLRIILLLSVILSQKSFSQTDCTTDPPLPPVLKNVTIEYETGATRLTWSPSPSPDVAAYIIYSFKSGDGLPIDTVWDPSLTSRLIPGNASKYFSVAYVVSAMRLPRCTSIFSNVINSIFTNATADTCNRNISISWNSYTPLPYAVTGYSVLTSANGSAYGDTSSAKPTDDNYILKKFKANANYCFVIRANLEGGTTSTSNKTCVTPKMKIPPEWINADFATVSDENKISLSFTYDPHSEISHFLLERKRADRDQYQNLSLIESSTGNILYTDNSASVDSIYYYRLSTNNGCTIPILVSNTATNIVLSVGKVENDLILSWNPYKKWNGTNSGYTLYVNTGSGFVEKEIIPAADTTFRLNYKDLMYSVTGKEVCFYINARETGNPYGVAGQSKSQSVCTEPAEIISVPNLFTPDNDLINDLFKPVLSFTPKDYMLIISNRLGRTIFESKDVNESWDGTLNGSGLPEDVYLWFLKVTTPTGRKITRTGTVTVLKKH